MDAEEEGGDFSHQEKNKKGSRSNEIGNSTGCLVAGCLQGPVSVVYVRVTESTFVSSGLPHLTASVSRHLRASDSHCRKRDN